MVRGSVSGRIFACLLAAGAPLLLGLAAAEEDVGSPLRVAQCRAKCVFTFGNPAPVFESCIKETDCFSCWEKCQLLESNFVVWGAVCAKSSSCGPGCRLACQFHHEGSAQKVPVLVTQGQCVVTQSGALISWPPPTSSPPPSSPLVYVVMRQLPGRSWRQLVQTMALSAHVPPQGSLRVLVVGRQGLVTIYSPADRLGPAQEVLRQLGQEALLSLRLPNPSSHRINTQLFSEPSQNPLDMLKDVDHGWNLRQLSLIHQKVLVIAEIAWSPQTSTSTAAGAGAKSAAAASTAAVYFVTWEVDGGGLRGNLFTDSTSVTLSLWPDTVYHIQVELVRDDWLHGGRSELLVLDTHTGVASGGHRGVAIRAPPHAAATHPHLPVLAGIGASLLSFLLALALFAWRYWGCAPRDKLQDLLDEPAHVFRVYPPAVRLNPQPSAPAPGGAALS